MSSSSSPIDSSSSSSSQSSSSSLNTSSSSSQSSSSSSQSSSSSLNTSSSSSQSSSSSLNTSSSSSQSSSSSLNTSSSSSQSSSSSSNTSSSSSSSSQSSSSSSQSSSSSSQSSSSSSQSSSSSLNTSSSSSNTSSSSSSSSQSSSSSKNSSSSSQSSSSSSQSSSSSLNTSSSSSQSSSSSLNTSSSSSQSSSSSLNTSSSSSQSSSSSSNTSSSSSSSSQSSSSSKNSSSSSQSSSSSLNTSSSSSQSSSSSSNTSSSSSSSSQSSSSSSQSSSSSKNSSSSSSSKNSSSSSSSKNSSSSSSSKNSSSSSSSSSSKNSSSSSSSKNSSSSSSSKNSSSSSSSKNSSSSSSSSSSKNSSSSSSSKNISSSSSSKNISSSSSATPTPEKFPTVSDNSISARNKSLYQDTSYVDLFKIRFDASSLGDAQGSKLKSFVREKFSIESKNSGIYLLGTFFDRNNNSYDIIDYLISNKQLIEIYQYFKSIIGIGIRTEIADMNYLLSSSYSYVVSYVNGWYVIKVKSNNYNKKESSINYSDDTLPSHNKYNSIHLGSSLISTRLYYDLYYTVNDFVSQTVLPKEYKNSIGGYLSDFSIFSVSKNIKSIYTDSIDLYLELNDYYKNLPVGSSTEILINDEIMAIELNKINIYDNSIKFVIKSRGLYKTPIQAHYINSIVKSIDDIDFFNSNFNLDGDYLYQYRCFALQIKANAGNFMCTNLKSYFDWNSSVNSTFDFGFEVPLIDRFIISGLKGTTSRISINDNLLNMAQQQMNGKVFNYNSFINMPVLIKSEDGFVHKRYITGYLEKQNQIELDGPLPFSISPGLEITFGPSKSRVAERGILLAESQDGLFSGFLGALSGLIGSNQNIVYNINEVISNRRSEIVKPGDTFYIWIKKIVKNNSISDLRQRLKFNFDCEVM